MSDEKLLTQKQLETIVLAAMAAKEAFTGRGLDEEGISKVVKWAEKIIIDYNLLRIVLDGQVCLYWDDEVDDMRFIDTDQCKKNIQQSRARNNAPKQ